MKERKPGDGWCQVMGSMGEETETHRESNK